MLTRISQLCLLHTLPIELNHSQHVVVISTEGYINLSVLVRQSHKFTQELQEHPYFNRI